MLNLFVLRFKNLLKWKKIIKNWGTLVKLRLGWIKDPQFEVRLRDGNTLHLWNRGKKGLDSDLVVLADIYFNTPYTLPPLKLPTNPTIIDIGANVGIFSIWAATHLTNAKIYSFEPSRNNYELLKKNILTNKLNKQISIKNLAITRAEQTNVPLYLSPRGSGGNSLFQECVTKHEACEYVNTTSLEKVLEEESIKTVDLLKLDCEGAEWEILMDTPAIIFEKIHQIAFELHELPGKSVQKLKEHLENLGFCFSDTRDPHIYYAKKNVTDKIVYPIEKNLLAKKHPFKFLSDRYLQAEAKFHKIEKIVPVRGKKILDFGAGSGAFSGYISERHGISSDLYDPSSDALDRAKQVFQLNGIVSSSLSDLPPNYDLITCWYVYGYVPDKQAFWEVIDTKLAPGGYLFMTINNSNSLFAKLASKQDGAYENWSFDPKDLPPGFRILQKWQDPIPSYLLTHSPNYKKWAKHLIYWAETIFYQPLSHFYVIQKDA